MAHFEIKTCLLVRFNGCHNERGVFLQAMILIRLYPSSTVYSRDVCHNIINLI